MRRCLHGLAFALLLAVAPAHAYAQSAVDEGVAAYENGAFAEAREAFARAEASDALSRSDLVRLFATRALLSFAEGQSEAMLHDLSALASLEPEYDLGPRAPPAVREALEEARGAGGVLRLSVNGARTEGGVQVRAEVEGDRAGLVRRLTLAARAPEGDWVRSEAGEVSLPGRAITTLAYHAQARGPGGAVLVSDGSEAVPQRLVLPPVEDEDGDDGVAIGLGVAGGVLAVAAAALVVALVVSDGGERVDVPSVEWP